MTTSFTSQPRTAADSVAGTAPDFSFNINALPLKERVLYDTGPSPNGIHGTMTFAICPRRRAWDLAVKQGGVGNHHSDGTARGTLMHVALAHHYARIRAKQRGEDPDFCYTPDVAVALVAKKAEGADHAVLSRWVPLVQSTFAAYKAHWLGEKLRVLAVEQVVEIPVPGLGGPGEPPMKTARIDLIVERRGKVYFWDHKGTARITRRHPWFYARSGQFLLLRWMGRALGQRFGGVVLNLVQIAQDTRFERPALDPVPGLLTSLPATLGYYERQRLAFESSGLPPEAWPALPTEHTCYHRYGECDHAARCDVAVPRKRIGAWPTPDLSDAIGEFFEPEPLTG